MEPDDLYRLPPDRFVPERAALARVLRAEGRRDEAAEVARLRKPSAAAWAVNQLVRGSAPEVAELFAAGDALRDAQTALLEGRGDGRALRDAGAREREAVEALVALVDDELNAATLERVGGTLHAAALDPAAREAVAGGRLERELRHAGLGLGDGADVLAAGAAAPAPARKQDGAAQRAPAQEQDGAAQRKAAKERAAAEKAAAAEREAARRRGRTAVAKAAKVAERAGQAVRAARERRERAAAALEEAEESLSAARLGAEKASEEHERARVELADL